MNFLVTVHTDIGIKKSTNQDSLCMKVAKTSLGRAAFAVICDGMGGLSKGELASATIVKTFSDWFTGGFPSLIYNGFSAERLKSQWESIILSENQKIMEYGKSVGVNLGTTVTVFLIFNGWYYVMNVGDTRAYEIGDNLIQITEDQTFVAREVKRGYMTAEQASIDPRRNVLLQCVGASDIVEPDFFVGTARLNSVYMLCSDGFRHEITEEEIFNVLNRNILVDEERMKANAVYLVELNKQRLEQDNISIALIRTY